MFFHYGFQIWVFSWRCQKDERPAKDPGDPGKTPCENEDSSLKGCIKPIPLHLSIIPSGREPFRMSRFLPSLLVLATLWASTQAAPRGISNIPAEITELVPASLLNFFLSLTAKDKAVIERLYVSHGEFQDFHALLGALKAKDQSLYDRLMLVFDHYHHQYNILTREAKEFVDSTISLFRSLVSDEGEWRSVRWIKGTIRRIVNTFDALDDGTQKDLAEKFPDFAKIFSNKLMKKAIESYRKQEA
ncbi:hypothetical protein L596_023266 [Steinernema carpocapsae]|uniref:Fatty-acid and retinol-binding protein 1 n=1 Tax=Steinernema carpocapsae TaxID=34508 RepID=A0A4U5MD49_STECR|nr:hypothetical protein L596_023266 [Steinernema carpocapsae]